MGTRGFGNTVPSSPSLVERPAASSITCIGFRTLPSACVFANPVRLGPRSGRRSIPRSLQPRPGDSMRDAYAVFPDGKSAPSAVFFDVEEAIDWGLSRYG